MCIVFKDAPKQTKKGLRLEPKADIFLAREPFQPPFIGTFRKDAPVARGVTLFLYLRCLYWFRFTKFPWLQSRLLTRRVVDLQDNAHYGM